MCYGVCVCVGAELVEEECVGWLAMATTFCLLSIATVTNIRDIISIRVVFIHVCVCVCVFMCGIIWLSIEQCVLVVILS